MLDYFLSHHNEFITESKKFDYFNNDHLSCSLADWTRAEVASILALMPAWTWATVCSARGRSSFLSCARDTTTSGSVSIRMPLSQISSRASSTRSILSLTRILIRRMFNSQIECSPNKAFFSNSFLRRLLRLLKRQSKADRRINSFS